MKTKAIDLISALQSDGFDLDQILGFLESGEALKALGIVDQDLVESAHDLVQSKRNQIK